eukprot:TRINITY_DN4685_c0_g1_i24.p2 TRINITY_DN4685_c0_g1~~TRINITY_DN4685_c0_g1_i24.p2  ORF type:complete len:176 (+),score=26.58 TRINITY_DN4685_c0_g1_i24:1360-1887(+)
MISSAPEERPSANAVLKHPIIKEYLNTKIPSVMNAREESKKLRACSKSIELINVQRSITFKSHLAGNSLKPVPDCELMRRSTFGKPGDEDITKGETLIIMKPVLIPNMKILKRIIKEESGFTEYSSKNHERVEAQGENLKTEDNEIDGVELNVIRYCNSDKIFRIHKFKCILQLK